MIIDDLDGLHRDAAAVRSSAGLEGPRRIDLAGRGIDQDRADVGLTIDPREVAGHEEATVGQHEEGLNLGY